MEAHAANFFYYKSRYKLEISTRKGKKAKRIKKKKGPTSNIDSKVDEEERKASPKLNTNMEMEGEN